MMSFVAVHTVSAFCPFGGGVQIPLCTCLKRLSDFTVKHKNSVKSRYHRRTYPALSPPDTKQKRSGHSSAWLMPGLCRPAVCSISGGEKCCSVSLGRQTAAASKPSYVSEGFHMWFLVQIAPKAVDNIAYFGSCRLHIS